ncbi:M23 family metallopeptidase [Chryseosolibacter indicus]|uniref:M23 family metallopeptidase n=1 Tax=Chryseosolibacter indicus TaxID=2782351 RepID=A0ABS5VNH4_9BACT|nr:M23 family metallopeptidase [Chryseosolibacter indicus]MBT1702671.1 M23 family metallopeptidase [Chryseosolibacter indicus]
MRPKKTLSSWLTTRYQLIIRSEENFAERTSVAFTYSKIILFSVIIFSFVFVISLFLVQTVLEKWFDPKYEQMVLNQQLYGLALKVDSLASEVEQKDKFIANFQKVLSGDTSSAFSTHSMKMVSAEGQASAKPASLKIDPADSAFRKDFEKSNLSLITLTGMKSRALEATFFFSPISGFISDKYDVKKGHFGVDVVAKTNEPVKCISDGTVIFSSWTQDAGYVLMIQHSANLISVYKHNAELYKKVGTFVNAGEIISIVGNSGEMTNGPHLHFELWYNGNSLNPEEFVTF